MRFPRALTIPAQMLAAIALGFALAGCQPGSNTHPVPSVAQIGGDLKCAQGDHAYEDQQAGWGFCYPESWKYTERSQASDTPPGLDLTFDITYVPAVQSSCPSPATASPCTGDFAFMIISTYERGDSTSLSSWANAHLPKTESLGPTITWGNSVEAAKLSDGKRIALTPHHVVIMDLHSGLLDLEGEMSSRLGTWKFIF